jgi:hypothetical protein
LAINRDTAPGFIVRFGHLRFSDFSRLTAEDLRHISTDVEAGRLLTHALCGSPHLLRRFRRAVPELTCVETSPSAAATAQARLVNLFALVLLREKAPPLYDALPWNTWNIGSVARRYKLWRTKTLVHGEHTPHTAANLARTAGLHVLEPSAAIRSYVERKCEIEKVKHLRLSGAVLDHIPLPDGSIDLAIVGPGLGSDPDRSFPELERVASSILLLQNRPGSESILADEWLVEHGFVSDRVQTGTGTRPCWWRMSTSLTEGT